MATDNLAGEMTPCRVLVIGGSFAGLFVGIALNRMGHDVDVIESATWSARPAMAAGIGLGDHVQTFLQEHDRLRGTPFCLPSRCFQVLGRDLETVREDLYGYDLTSWDAVYYRLRANFDGFSSSYCPQPPARQASDGKATFRSGVRALSVHDAGEQVRVRVRNNSLAGEGEVEVEDLHAKLVIAADGGHSTIRQQLEPTVVHRDAGYMLWRGIARSQDVSPTLRGKLNESPGLYAVPDQKSFLVMYIIPGLNGALSQEQRMVNLAWYRWPTSRAETLTGVDGHCHRRTLPKGQVRPDVWAAQMAWAKSQMHPDISSLLARIEQPFAAAVSSAISSRASYFDDKLFLVGDALAQVQPNTGQGANLAAMAALALAQVISHKMTTGEYETRVLEAAREANGRAIAMAASFME